MSLKWTPIAGGTDLMVQYAAANWLLADSSHCRAARIARIEVAATEIRIGAGCTYTGIRQHRVIAEELPLLVRSA
jgi:CO/xanthine dehydrogenase FAD-binding subunit